MDHSIDFRFLRRRPRPNGRSSNIAASLLRETSARDRVELQPMRIRASFDDKTGRIESSTMRFFRNTFENSLYNPTANL